MLTIDMLNEKDNLEFVEIVGEIFEHSPWIAKKAAAAKPFSSVDHLHKEMVKIVINATMDQKLALINAHPNLGDRIEMSKDSIHEQQGAGLKDLSVEEYNKFLTLNKAYSEKFGFPFILAVRGKNKHEIYQAMETRIQNQKETEFHAAMAEIYKIAQLRLEEKIQSGDFS